MRTRRKEEANRLRAEERSALEADIKSLEAEFAVTHEQRQARLVELNARLAEIEYEDDCGDGI